MKLCGARVCAEGESRDTSRALERRDREEERVGRSQRSVVGHDEACNEAQSESKEDGATSMLL